MRPEAQSSAPLTLFGRYIWRAATVLGKPLKVARVKPEGDATQLRLAVWIGRFYRAFGHAHILLCRSAEREPSLIFKVNHYPLP